MSTTTVAQRAYMQQRAGRELRSADVHDGRQITAWCDTADAAVTGVVWSRGPRAGTWWVITAPGKTQLGRLPMAAG